LPRAVAFQLVKSVSLFKVNARLVASPEHAFQGTELEQRIGLSEVVTFLFVEDESLVKGLASRVIAAELGLQHAEVQKRIRLPEVVTGLLGEANGIVISYAGFIVCPGKIQAIPFGKFFCRLFFKCYLFRDVVIRLEEIRGRLWIARKDEYQRHEPKEAAGDHREGHELQFSGGLSKQKDANDAQDQNA